MCEEWSMWRRRREADEARRLWDEFDRTQPVSEPERTDEREVTLEEPEDILFTELAHPEGLPPADEEEAAAARLT